MSLTSNCFCIKKKENYCFDPRSCLMFHGENCVVFNETNDTWRKAAVIELFISPHSNSSKTKVAGLGNGGT